MIVSITVATLLGAPAFIDRTADLGLTLGDSAACWVDLDGNGRTDLCTGGAVWFNRGGVKFEKGPDVGTVVAADIDNDGDNDLFSWSQMRLLRNDGKGAFEPFALPNLPKSVSRGACWADLDGDGFVDLYVGGYENWGDQVTYPDMVLMNRKGESFELVWTNESHRARGVSACDFDRDGRPDVYVSNYRLHPNDLWTMEAAGEMKNRASALGVLATSEGFGGGHSIGSAWGDFDDDGRIDLFAGNFAHVDSRGDQPKSRFLRNAEDGFKDRGTCGVFYQESYASPAAGDYDNDGDLDLYFTTVYETASFGKKNYPVLFANDGNFAFTDVTAGTGLEELGATYQAAWADFDQDGDLDLVTDGKLFVNQSSGSQWLEVRLVGDGKKVNRSAIGAQVRVQSGGRTMTRQVEAGTGEGNQNDLVLHFGLGSASGKVDVEVYWPNGETQVVKDVQPGRTLAVRYGRGR